MNTQIQIFNNPQFGEIRTTTTESGDPLFCAVDITRVLGYKNGRKAVNDNCNTKGVTTSDTLTNGGIQQLTYVNESNLYRLIMKSKLPDAEKFQDWVCEEILPSIRKHGGYIATKEDDTDESIMARALIIATNTMESLKAKNKLLESCNIDNVKKLNEQAPKVLFADSVMASHKSVLVGELAKILAQKGYKIGQNRLFEWLRNNGYLLTRGESYNLPSQVAIEQGLFEIKKTTIDRPDGTILVTNTTKVTGKGQVYFVNKFLSK